MKEQRNGWMILDKPVGPTSADMVARVKHLLREAGFAKGKVGHGGTLDPLASGVLPIALGEATKICGRILEATKIYHFTLRFGEETDSLDCEGQIIARSPVRPTQREIHAILPRFLGKIEQIPPAFSAIKQQGKPAYIRARAGEDLILPPRKLVIHTLSLHMAKGAGEPQNDLSQQSLSPSSPPQPSPDMVLADITLATEVSKGTYIRALARDIARALGTVGHVTMLRRTKAGMFSLDHAISLDYLLDKGNIIRQEGAIRENILPLEAGLVDIPALTLSPEAVRAARDGRPLPGNLLDGKAPQKLYWARDEQGCPVALLEVSASGLRVLRGFNL